MFHQLCTNEQVYCEATAIVWNQYLLPKMNLKMDYIQDSDFEEEEERKDKISKIEKGSYHIMDYQVDWGSIFIVQHDSYATFEAIRVTHLLH